METEQRILAEARDLFREQGLSGVSMRRVAERVGVSATAIYRHFESKDALMASVLDRGFSIFHSYLARGLAGSTPLVRFRAMVRGYYDFALEHRPYYEVMFLTPCEELGFIEISQEIKERGQSTFVFLVDRVKECMSAGVFSEGDPERVSLHVWSQTHGTASLWLYGQLSEAMTLDEFRQHAQVSTELLIQGLKPKRRRARRRSKRCS